MKDVNTSQEYLDDRDRVSEEELARIRFQADLIIKIAEARNKKGFSQRDLAKASGIKQPAIARLESQKQTPRLAR